MLPELSIIKAICVCQSSFCESMKRSSVLVYILANLFPFSLFPLSSIIFCSFLVINASLIISSSVRLSSISMCSGSFICSASRESKPLKLTLSAPLPKYFPWASCMSLYRESFSFSRLSISFCFASRFFCAWSASRSISLSSSSKPWSSSVLYKPPSWFPSSSPSCSPLCPSASVPSWSSMSARPSV